MAGSSGEGGDLVFQSQPDPFEGFQLLLLAKRLRRIDQPIEPAMAAAKAVEIVLHGALQEVDITPTTAKWRIGADKPD
nr:hypothetical protein [Erythrobacter litoralis]